MKKQPIAIAFSDVHINLWSKFNTDNKRTLYGFKAIEHIKKQCLKKGIPALFLGDLLHKSESIDNDLFSILVDKFIELGEEPFWNCYFIEGNHEIKNKNELLKIGKAGEPNQYTSPGFIQSLSKLFSWLRPIDGYQTLYGGYKVWGISYLDHNKNLNKHLTEIILRFNQNDKNILLLHTDYPGAKDTDDREIGSSENINVNLINKFDLVLSGHIHKPQRVSKKVYIVGATNQQRRTDKNCDMGYWIIYSDLSMKFKSLSRKFPKFIDVENEEDIKDDGNYYTIIPKKNLVATEQRTNKINANLSKTKLARRYMKEKGINDKGKAKLLHKLLKDSNDD